jgi:alanine racemase
VTPSIWPSRAWVEVDLSALLSNARTVQSTAGAPLLPMVKANGYGLGAVAIARALEAIDPWGYGVATTAEAEELRSAGITRPIIVFTPWTLATEGSGAGLPGVRHVIGDAVALDDYLGTGHDRQFHLEIDTGMSRAGIRWDDRASFQRAAAILENATQWEGVFTHFHSADTDARSAKVQWERLQDVVAKLPRRPAMVHASGSAGAMYGKAFAGDLVRPGIYLYGGSAGMHAPAPAPVARIRAHVVALRTVRGGDGVSYSTTWRATRDTLVATLAYGYADGLHRSGSSRAVVQLNGVEAPVLGRVTMDMTMVEAPAGTQLGDIATILGDGISLETLAQQLGTNSYEVLTSIGPRVPRRHR